MLKMALVMLTLLTAACHITAQPASTAPLIILMQGDFWSWDTATQALTPLTTTGSADPATFSPDGRRFAYRATAPAAIEDAVQHQYLISTDGPSDIWVYDIAAGTARLIAGQPPEAAPNQPDALAAGVIRSSPDWLVDGSALIWTEYVPDDNTMQVVRYTFASGTATVIAKGLSIGYQDGGLRLSNVSVGTDRITNSSPFTYVSDALPMGGGSETDVYDLDGNLIKQEISGPFSLNNPIVPASQPRPLTRQNPSEQYSLDNPGGSGTVYSTTTLDAENHFRTSWYFRRPEGTSYALGDNLTNQAVTLSPDGQAAAVVRDDGVYIVRGAEAERIPGTESVYDSHPYRASGDTYGVLWGRTGWRDRSDMVLTPVPTAEATPDSVNCIMASDLFAAGMQGRVKPDLRLPLNLFGRLPLSGRIGLVQPGTVFTVSGGPDCSWEGYPAWLIAFDDQKGWIVQQDDTETGAWVEPLP